MSAVLDRYRAVCAELAGLRLDTLTTPEQFAVLEAIETGRRQLPVLEHEAISRIAARAGPGEIGGSLKQVLADRLRISPAEARRRIADAAVCGPRTAISGQPLEPVWPAAAAAQRRGQIGAAHLGEIRRFLHRLPGWVDAPTRAGAEAELAGLATKLRPDELRVAAAALADCLNPDGTFSDTDRARRRGISIGGQGPDGMSEIHGYLTPQARAYLDAVLAKLAAPGMANPADQSPVVDAQPSEQAAATDQRSQPQRHHDALAAAMRALLACGALGTHHGLPVAVVVSTTLGELQSGAGKARTGAGTWLPMTDLIRMASHAHHYLVVFDQHSARPLYLGEAKRIASPGQRIVLHAKDRGCSAPGCSVPGYLCDVHHVEEWSAGGRTDIDNLTFACRPHHRLLDQGWKTRKRYDGTTQWLPPPHLDRGQPRTNNYHHPQRYLTRHE